MSVLGHPFFCLSSGARFNDEKDRSSGNGVGDGDGGGGIWLGGWQSDLIWAGGFFFVVFPILIARGNRFKHNVDVTDCLAGPVMTLIGQIQSPGRFPPPLSPIDSPFSPIPPPNFPLGYDVATGRAGFGHTRALAKALEKWERGFRTQGSKWPGQILSRET